MNKYKNPPGGNFASEAVWHAIAFKVSVFHFFGQKLTDVPIWSTFLISNLITIIVAERYGSFCNTHECVITVGVVFVCTVLRK